MSFDRNGKFYYLNLIKNRFKHGMVLFTLRNLFTRMGVDISPYYWVQEGVDVIDEPQIKGNPENYIVSYFDYKDICEIIKTKTAYKTEILLAEFEK